MKKTLHFSKADLKEIYELVSLLGVEGYGDIPKALKFSVTYTKNGLKRDEKVIPNLNPSEFDFWLSSISTLKKAEKKVGKIREIDPSSQKVIPYWFDKYGKSNTNGKKEIKKIN